MEDRTTHLLWSIRSKRLPKPPSSSNCLAGKMFFQCIDEGLKYIIQAICGVEWTLLCNVRAQPTIRLQLRTLSVYTLGVILTYIGVFSLSRNTFWSDQSPPIIFSDNCRSKFHRTLASTIFISTQARLWFKQSVSRTYQSAEGLTSFRCSFKAPP